MYEYTAEDLAKDVKAIEVLTQVKELLEEFNLPKTEDWDSLLGEMGDKIKGSGLPVFIHDYGNKYDYSSEGKKAIEHGERLSYAPITIDIPSSAAWFYFYDKEENNYDIDDDIALLQKRVETQSYCG